MKARDQRDILYNRLINIGGILGIILTIVIAIWAYQAGILTDETKMTEMLEGAGVFGPIIFFIIQIIQTVVPIIPGALTVPAGEIVFGPLWGFVLNYTSIVVGSIMAFYICRTYGRRLLWVLIGENHYQKYIGLLEKSRFNDLFIWGVLVPFMPADIFCMVAGVSTMSDRRFMTTLILCKPISLYLYTVFSVWMIDFCLGNIIL